MKNYLALVVALAVVSSPAHASRARLESLGEGKNGSYYIDDSRNIFLNPAQVVHYKKKLMLELGTEPGASQDAAVTNNRAQGGFTNTFGDYTYALYLNNNSERANTIVSGANSALTALGSGEKFLGPDSTLEAFFAGEGSMNWGISVFYSGNAARGSALGVGTGTSSGLEQSAYLIGTRLGVEFNNWSIFSTVGIADSSKVKNATNDEIKGKVSVDVAVVNKMDAWTTFAKFSTYGADASLGGATTQNRNTAFGLGLGYKKEFSKTVTMFSRFGADYLKSTNQGGLAAQAANTYWNVPIVLGAEAQAMSWLAIRGSIAQSLLGQHLYGYTKDSLQGTTTVSAGVGMTFGDVQIDGLVATTGGTNTNNGTSIGTLPGFGTAPQTDTTFGFGNNMISRIAMTYNF